MINNMDTRQTIQQITREIELIREKEKQNLDTSKFMRNVIILIAAQLLIKILGLVYKVVIVNMPGFGDVGNGYYSSGYEVYAVLLTISSIGIPNAISKLVSERIAIGDNYGAKRIFKTALAFFGGVGFAMSFGLYAGSGWIAENIMGAREVSGVLKVLAPAIFFVSISAVVRGYFAGMQEMKPISYSQTLEQLLNAMLSILLVYIFIGRPAYEMAAIGNLATTISVVLAFMYLITFFRRYNLKVNKKDKKKSKEHTYSTAKILKTILKISLPLTIGSLLSVAHTFIDTVTISQGIQKGMMHAGVTKEIMEQTAMEAKGMLTKVNTLIGLPQAVNVAIAATIVPSIAALLAKGHVKQATDRMRTSINITFLIVFPSVIGMYVLAEPILHLLYPQSPDGAVLFKMLAISSTLICLSHTVNASLQGMGDYITPSVVVFIGTIIKLFLNTFLIPIEGIGVYGAAISSIIAQAIGFSIVYYTIKKKTGFSINFKEMLGYLFVSIIMGAIAYMSYSLLSGIMPNEIATVLAIVVGGIAYVYLVLKFRVIDKETLKSIPKTGKIIKRMEWQDLKKERKRQEKNRRKERLKRNDR